MMTDSHNDSASDADSDSRISSVLVLMDTDKSDSDSDSDWEHPTNEPIKRLTHEMTLADPEIRISPNPDIITKEIDPDNPCAAMQCGHAITPASLTSFMRSLVTSQSAHVITCPAERDPSGDMGFQEMMRRLALHSDEAFCKRIWDYKLCRKMAMLTPVEEKFFEHKLSKNYTTQILHTKQCPRCNIHYFNDSQDSKRDVRINCTACGEGDFCWRCGNIWKTQSQVICGNDQCAGGILQVVKILQECPTKIISTMNVPSVRACPNPACLRRGTPQLIEHHSGCKHMKCVTCGGSFCHACLQMRTDQGYPASCGGAQSACSAGVAPRQTRAKLQP